MRKRKKNKPYRRYPGDTDALSCLITCAVLGVLLLFVLVTLFRPLL